MKHAMQIIIGLILAATMAKANAVLLITPSVLVPQPPPTPPCQCSSNNDDMDRISKTRP